MPSTDWHALTNRDRHCKRSYTLRQATADRLNARASQEGLGVSELIDYLLATVLDQVDAGELTIPTVPGSLRAIDWSAPRWRHR